MDIVYCERWDEVTKVPINLINLLNRSSAAARHKQRQPYVALIGGSQNPHYIVDIAADWVSVDFMDATCNMISKNGSREVIPKRGDLQRIYIRSGIAGICENVLL